MKEKDFQQEFKRKNDIVGVFELKLCKGKSIPFKAVADHQLEALKDVQSGDGLYHKISDVPVSYTQVQCPRCKLVIKTGRQNRFTKPKPFDCFYLRDLPAYIVIMFYEPRKKKRVYYITPEAWEELKNTSERKSATEVGCLLNASIIRDFRSKQ